MTTGHISSKYPTTFFSGSIPSVWSANIIGYVFNNQTYAYTFTWNRTILLNGFTYSQYSGNQTYTTGESGWSPGTAVFTVGSNMYNGATAYTLANAKQVVVSSTAGTNGKIQRKLSSTYYDLPYTATYKESDALTIVLKAIPNTHFVWDAASSKWNHDNDTTQERTITLAASFAALVDISYSATYTQTAWLLTTVGSANGTAYIGESPSTTTTAWYATGQTVSIRANATTDGYKFSKWTIGVVDYSTSPTISISTASADSTYTAVFIPISYTLNVSSENVPHGTVSVFLAGSEQLTQTGLSVSSGIAYASPVVNPTGVEVRAVPVFGYYFTGWYIGASLESSLANYTFSMPESNVSIEARFSVLSTATITVTKTKGNAGDTADAKDQGVVSLYHLESVLDLTSAAGTATLVASLYTTLQYKLVPAPASNLYQFDGWYKTVGEAQELITTGGIYVVDGINLYVTPTTTAAIPVNAQFRECILCTIAPVASDSSTYVAENDAETAGCTCAVTTLPPDYDAESVGLHDVGDKWLSSQTITMQAQQAVGWELRAWIVKRVSDGQVVSSKSKGDVGFGQTFTFSILANVQVIAVSAYTLPPNQFQIRVLIKSGLSNSSGTLEIHPCGDSYVEMSNGASANVDEYSICEITAIPANGYKFVGWRVASEGSSIISTNPVYLFTVSSSAIYYAEFEAVDEEMLVLFESSSANATMRWAGKTLVSSVPVCLSSARVYADAYPVKLSIGMSDNPSHPANAGNIISSIASSQNPFRLPMRRPRKSILLEIEATDTISALCVATSMEDLKNG